jgi:hypothetical protein
LTQAGDPLTRLNELARIALGESAAFNVALWSEAAHDPPLARALAARDARNHAALARLLAPACAEPDAAAYALLAALDGLAQRQALNHFDSETACARFAALVALILRP